MVSFNEFATIPWIHLAKNWNLKTCTVKHLAYPQLRSQKCHWPERTAPFLPSARGWCSAQPAAPPSAPRQASGHQIPHDAFDVQGQKPGTWWAVRKELLVEMPMKWWYWCLVLGKSLCWLGWCLFLSLSLSFYVYYMPIMVGDLAMLLRWVTIEIAWVISNQGQVKIDDSICPRRTRCEYCKAKLLVAKRTSTRGVSPCCKGVSSTTVTETPSCKKKQYMVRRGVKRNAVGRGASVTAPVRTLPDLHHQVRKQPEIATSCHVFDVGSHHQEKQPRLTHISNIFW